MTFWQENKVFVIICGVLFAVVIYLWPSLIGAWGAPLSSPVVVRPQRGAYSQAAAKIAQAQEKLQTRFSAGAGAMPIGEAAQITAEDNDVLLANFKEMHRWVSYVPRFPFRIPAGLEIDGRKGKDAKELSKEQKERLDRARRYVSNIHTYACRGGLECEEYRSFKDDSDGLLTADPNKVDDKCFVEWWKELKDIDPEADIIKIGLAHELGQLAIRANVDEIVQIEPQNSYTWRVKDIDVATVYPVDIHFKSDLKTLLTFLHGLDGAHGEVVEVRAAPHKLPVPDDTRKPAEPGDAREPGKPPAIPEAALPVVDPGEDREDDPEAPKAAPVPDAARPVVPGEATPDAPPDAPPDDTYGHELLIKLHGAPWVCKPESGTRPVKERLTIFRPSPGSHTLTYIANAVVMHEPKPPQDTRRSADAKGEEPSPAEQGSKASDGAVFLKARIETCSTVRYTKKGERADSTKVRRGDHVASRFFLVLSLNAESRPEKPEFDKDGYLVDLVPDHLDVELSVAAIEFLQIKMPKVAQAKRPKKEPPPYRGW